MIVAGHLVADEIMYAGGSRVSALGGISYNLMALLSIMKTGKIMPVCEIGLDKEDLFEEYFGKHDIVDSSAVRKTPLPNVVNRLVYSSDGNREEWNSRIPGRLSLEIISSDVDAALMNFISGDDMSVEELTEFRKRFEGIIFCDYHSLALGRDSEGKRYYRKHPDWDKYLSQADIVQMNIAELATISGVKGLSFGNIIAVCGMIHNLHPDICIITLGRNGLVLSIEKGNQVYHIPPVTVHNDIDPTGCGDTLAAVFLYNYLLSCDPLQSAMSANRYAAAKVTFGGLGGFKGMNTILESIGRGAEPVKIK